MISPTFANDEPGQGAGSGGGETAAPTWRRGAVLFFRVAVAVALGCAAALGWTSFGWPTSLSVAVSIMCGLVLVETIGISRWEKASVKSPPTAGAPANPYADFAKVTLTTQGVVLGLVAFAGPAELNLTLKIGAASLAAGVVVASIMYVLVVQGPPAAPNLRAAASILFSVLLWSLAFGLVCVVAGNW